MQGTCITQPGDGVTEVGTTLTVCCCRLRPRAVGILQGEGEEGGGGEGQHSSAPGPGTKGVEAKGPGDPTPRLVWTQWWEEVQAQLLGEVALVQAYKLEDAKLDFGGLCCAGPGKRPVRCGGERAGLGPAAVGEGGGPRGESVGRLPTAGPNAELVRTYGHLLSDALARWVQLELVCGPYKKDELPWVSVRGGELFLDAKIAPVSIVIKGDVVNG